MRPLSPPKESESTGGSETTLFISCCDSLLLPRTSLLVLYFKMSIEEQPFLSESKSSEVSQESLLEKVNYQERKWTSKLRLENFNYVFSLNSVAVVNGIAIIASIYFYYATWKKGLAINRYCPEIPYCE